jgi:AcrR family transcriptional regulator
MSDTKERIRKVAEQLFFDQGIANTRLQQIADEAGMSVGNLAYHFRNKEAIVGYVYDHLFQEFSDILSAYLQLTDLRDLDHHFDALYHFFLNNAFYLNNVWEIERTFPEIKEKWLTFNKKIILQLRKRLEYNQQRGMLVPEPYRGAYDMLAQTLWMIVNGWIPQQMLQQKKISSLLYRKSLWGIIFPYLTLQGKLELQEAVAITL